MATRGAPRMGNWAGDRAGGWRGWRSWQGPRTSKQRLALAIVALVMMILPVVPMFADPIDYRAPVARNGVVDYSTYGVPRRPVQIAGQWRLTWIAPSLAPGVAHSGLIPVPGQWTGQALPGGAILPLSGHVRYDVVLRGLRPGRYQMHVPVLWAGNRITIDGRTVSGHGTIGDSAADTRYYLRAQNLTFDATGGDLALGIEMATFLHRENGIEEPPVFGTAGAMDRWTALKWSREHLYNISLLLIASLGIAVWLFRPSDRASLYFGLSCLTFLPTSAILGFDNVLQIMFPQLAYTTSLAIQYLTGVVAVSFFFLNAHELFPRESSKWMARAILTLFAAVFAIHTYTFLRGDTVAASLTQQKLFMPIALFTLLYMVAILIRAAWNRRDGALVYLLGIGMFVFSFIVSATVLSGWISKDKVIGYELVTLGIVMLLYSHVVLMAERWSIAVGNAEQINDD